VDRIGGFDAQPVELDESAPAWKQEVNQRLAAHRNKRGGAQADSANPVPEGTRSASARAAAAAARVAARYAKAPSYHDLLAGEARAVAHAAGAAAEAALTAQAAAEAVLAGLESGPMSADATFATMWGHNAARPTLGPAAPAGNPAVKPASSRWQDEPAVAPSPTNAQAPEQAPWAGAQPRWEESLPLATEAAERDVWSEMRVHPEPSSYRPRQKDHSGRRYADRAEEGELFPDSIEAEDDPMGSATVEPLQHLPANLIEFPREIVAVRKARPRLAEGPFYDASQENPQLSIFEVDPRLLAPPVFMNGTAAMPVAPPEWASIELGSELESELESELDHPGERAQPSFLAAPGTQPVRAAQVYAVEPEIPVALAAAEGISGQFSGSAIDVMPLEETHTPAEVPFRESAPAARAWVSQPAAVAAQVSELLVARVSDRLLAAVVDGALVTLAFVAAAVVVIASTAHPPTGRIALIASGVALLLFGALYQFLFLSYAEEGTPGMRYARIALCTFDDDNPTVAQMRMRIPALLLSALPAGVGLLWAVWDSEHLGWHDRLTRTYQRKY